ncbi:hypothetical protein D3C76_1513990 [compost metagenome]
MLKCNACFKRIEALFAKVDQEYMVVGAPGDDINTLLNERFGHCSSVGNDLLLMGLKPMGFSLTETLGLCCNHAIERCIAIEISD